MSGNFERRVAVLSFVVLLLIVSMGDALAKIPYLQKKGTATQLIVDGRPYVMLGAICIIQAHRVWNIWRRFGISL
jgi:hypothetical protein